MQICNNALLQLLDSIAVVKKLKSATNKLMPWLNEGLMNIRRKCGKAERQWRSSRLHVFLQAWKDSLRDYQTAMSATKTNYFSSLIGQHKRNSKLLFKTVAQLTESNKAPK